MPPLTPSERALRARLAAHQSWANTPDPTARTAAARAKSPGHLDYWCRQVDPTGKLPEHERLRRAESARKAYYTRLALRSAQARRARAGKRAS